MLAMESTFVRAALFLYPYHLAIARMPVMFRPAPACHKQLVQTLVSMGMATAVVLVGQTQHQDLSGKTHARVYFRVACTAADRPLELIHAMHFFLALSSLEVALELIHAMEVRLVVISSEVALELIHAMQRLLVLVALNLLEIMNATAVPAAAHVDGV
jgi:hypothetical protein